MGGTAGLRPFCKPRQQSPRSCSACLAALHPTSWRVRPPDGTISGRGPTRKLGSLTLHKPCCGTLFRMPNSLKLLRSIAPDYSRR